MFKLKPEDLIHKLQLNDEQKKVCLGFIYGIREEMKEVFGLIVSKFDDFSFMLTGSSLPASRAVNPNLNYLTSKSKLSVSSLSIDLLVSYLSP